MTDMLKFFNLTQGEMNGSQVVQTILMIQEDYWFLTLADFKVFFSKIKKGHYGQVYNRMDGQMILGWLSDYAAERANTAATMSEVDAHQQKDRDERVYTPEMLQRLYGEHWTQRKDLEEKRSEAEFPPFDERTASVYLQQEALRGNSDEK